MNKNLKKITSLLKSKNLKITPQRIVILESIYKLNNHPTTEQIYQEVRKKNPTIATGTVYKVLDILTDNKIINKVTTEKGVIRYDAKLDNHHHIYYKNSDIIDDYEDQELDDLLNDYFSRKTIANSTIDNFVLQIHVIPNK